MNNKSFNESVSIANHVKSYLATHHLSHHLPDISYEILALHLIDAINKSSEIEALFSSEVGLTYSSTHLNPNSDLFDPISAVFTLKNKNYDEACWLSFLMIYTDDSADAGWTFIRQLYSGMSLLDTPLTWNRVNKHNNSTLLDELADKLASFHPKPKFGHHRAYESLTHLPMVFSSYVRFINEYGGHRNLFKPYFTDKGNQLPIIASKPSHQPSYFNTLYLLFRQNIYRFGRLSTFEYLCWLGKTGLASITPDSCYIAEASGPKRGAKLLFGMLSNVKLDEHAVGLADYLNVGYQEVEAALCHWQKSPKRYVQR